MALVVPGALHMGYGWVQISMSDSLLGLPLWMVIALPFAKILSTSLSIGSGGSGGIFGPGMVIGGMLGATFWRLGYGTLPDLPQTPAPFVIVGMMALFGGIAHAPLAVMLMVAEMTGNLSMLAPAMVAVGVSTALVGDNTIYRSQLPSRASSPAHRMRFAFPLLSSLLVRDAMTPAAAPARATLPSTAGPEPLRAEQPLDDALEQLADRDVPWLPVVSDGRIVGGLSVRDAVRTYKRALTSSTRRARTLPEDTSVFEVRLRADSPVVGRTLREASLPRRLLVAAIRRAEDSIFPTASTRLEVGDVLTVLAEPATEAGLRQFFDARQEAHIDGRNATPR
jgi:CIC family chloride channel protein